jgi:arylsulfatase A-like enzyme
MKAIVTATALLVATAIPAAPPNIVLILADDLGQRDLGCYGSKFHQTPHIDALASKGMRFTNAYSASPLCSPTRASILTGLAPARIGITSPVCHMKRLVLEKQLTQATPKQRLQIADSLTRLKTDYLTLPEYLLKTGWQTGHLGKWHLGPEPYSPLQHGFQSDLPHTPGPGPGGEKGYFAPWEFWPDQGQPGDHIEDRMALEAEKFISDNKEHPFFLNYWAFSVHSPWMAKEEYVNDASSRVDQTAEQRNAMYAAMLRSLDEAVGRITAALEKNGLTENTIILFTGDNGGYARPPKKTNHTAWAEVPVTSNAPYRSGKASNYEGGSRVPLMVCWPGKITAGSKSDAIVQSTDFFPTLLDMLQLPHPDSVKFDGQSFAPALKGESLKRDTIYSHFPHGDQNAQVEGFRPATWVRQANWKLIRFFADHSDGSDKLELYDLQSDVSETKNLAAHKPELTTKLNALISSYLAETEAVVPKLNPNYIAPAAKDPLRGWKAKLCQTSASEGILKITPQQRAESFLGIGIGKLGTGAKLVFRIKSSGSSGGKVAWLPKPANGKTQQAVDYTSKAGDWEEVTTTLPTEANASGILRLYLPNAVSELDWIELQPTAGKPQRWDF